MRVREITEGWFDSINKFKQLQSTQDIRRNIPVYKAQPRAQYPAGQVLPDPGHVLVVTLPRGGRYYKDIQGRWWNELRQSLETANTAALEQMLARDQYKQAPDPAAPAATQPNTAYRRMSRRRGVK